MTGFLSAVMDGWMDGWIRQENECVHHNGWKQLKICYTDTDEEDENDDEISMEWWRSRVVGVGTFDVRPTQAMQ